MSEKILDFWNERAGLGAIAGTNDFNLTEIEHRFLETAVPSGSRILDVGCGNGSSLVRLAKAKGCHGVGMDFAEQMVEVAAARVRDEGLSDRLEVHRRSVPPVPNEWGPFDVVYSQRCLINLTSTDQQKTAVLSVADCLRPGGMYVMVECSLDGSDRTNSVRESLGLQPIDPPWHNLFFREKEVASWANEGFVLEDLQHISSTYNFLSRVVYAKLAADRGEELRYDSDINLLSLKLPPAVGAFGPVKAWIWRKRV
ncbi:MAG: SAM-dependent methyltransferase [Kiloniellales bacterium]